jgi:predicted dehydrogenase
MDLSDELKDRGRRNFLKAIAGAPAVAALGAATVARGPVRGGPVKMALIGTGGMGSGHVKQFQKSHLDLRALCDINPKRRADAAATLVKGGWPEPKQYDSWREMLEKEDLEAVLIATPLWTHAEIAVGCLDAGKHVLCEKMMAKSEADCLRMIDASRRNKRLLEIGYQRYYNPMYQATYNNIIKQGLLGEVYHARLAWHRNSSWRKEEEPPSPNFDPSAWGYPDWEHLLNWRMYRQYSEGLIAELGSHQITATSWFFDSAPESVYTQGSISRFKDGREVFDHVYSVFEYPGGRTATFSSIQSNAFEDAYEMFMGTRGTLILKHEDEAYLFQEGDADAVTKVEVSRQSANPILDASATRAPDSPRQTVAGQGGAETEKALAYRNEVSEFCAAIRTGSAIRCGTEKAMKSAVACLTANRSADKRLRLEIGGGE